MARKPWAELSDPYRRRLERAGITPVQYTSGASLKAARGHATTPERPSRAFRHPDLYGDYLRRRVAKGKPVPTGIIGEPQRRGAPRLIGDAIGWPGRDSLQTAIVTRTPGGSIHGSSGTITILEAVPETGDYRLVRTIDYNQADFKQIVQDLKDHGYVVQVVSTPALGVTA